MISFLYRGKAVQIIPEMHKKQLVYYIVISGKRVTFVSNVDTAKRIATNFIDVVLGEEFQGTYQSYSPSHVKRS